MSKYTDRINMRFSYTPSGATDIRRTFAKARRKLAEEAAKREAEEKATQAEAVAKVRRIAK